MKKIVLLLLFVLMSCASTAEKNGFYGWLDGVKAEARDKGISRKVIRKAFKDVSYNEKVVNLDRNQPESKRTFENYLNVIANPIRIKKGQDFYKENWKELELVAKHYHIPAQYIVALLGVETNYGNNFGNYSVINSLATMAYDNRRSEFFRKELFYALEILDKKHITLENMKGSWAGAMGQNQFMPSSFLSYAVDYDKDGHKDIWDSKLDVFASTANYLASYGFNDKEKWGRKVILPKGFDSSLLGLDNKKSVNDWKKLGVKNKNRREMPDSNMQGSIIAPDGVSGPAYLVYDNFRVFMKWNRSLHFGVSVGLIANQIK